MSGQNQYSGKIELSGSLAYLEDAHKHFYDRNLDESYPLPQQAKDVGGVATALHQAGMSRYRFEVAETFSVSPGEPVTIYEVELNPETKEGVLYVADRLSEEGMTEDMRQAYRGIRELTNSGDFSKASPDQISRFDQVFQGFLDHIVYKK